MPTLPDRQCSVTGCVRPLKVRGMCDTHYSRQRRNGHTNLLIPKREAVCTVEGCNRPHEALGLCRNHYSRKCFRAKQTSRMTAELANAAQFARETDERWRPIPGYEDQYHVSEYGRVRSQPRFDIAGRLRKARELSPAVSNGYRYVQLYQRGVCMPHRMHVLVALAFIGPRPDGLVVNHIDHDRFNNHVSNLEYVTQRENIHAAVAAGRMHHRPSLDVARTTRYSR